MGELNFLLDGLADVLFNSLSQRRRLLTHEG